MQVAAPPHASATVRKLIEIRIILAMLWLAGCASNRGRETARATDEAHRYELAQQSWQSKNAAALSPTKLGRNAEGAKSGKVSLCGIETDAARVIFVIDVSGSMMTKFARARDD